MTTFLKTLFGIGCWILALTGGALGQSLQQQGIANTTQILNTSVLFAIGAREAEQALRGSFGWPTFQEGFVDRVYFRFDPDGYARFSTSPRLDEDVFEVICAESSTACLAKKPSLEIGLTVEGKIQIKIADITPQDTFFVSDRKSELPLPPTLLEPLDARLETLLASGGHLIVKREVETIQEISLAGFSAVTTYLRWVAQGQSPRVFPRGWPVPAQIETRQAGQLTQPGAWVTPNAGPQQVQTTFTQSNMQQSEGLRANPSQAFQAGIIKPLQGVATTANGFGSNNFAQEQTDYRQVPLGSTVVTIQSLQRELAQLRAMQNPTGQGGAVEPIDESAIGFAQQAQARNLQTAGGFGNTTPIQSEQLPASTYQSHGGVTEFQAERMPQSLDRHSLNALEARLYALEVAMLDLKRVFISEIRAVKIEPVALAQKEALIPVVGSAVDVQNEPDSMAALEKLLLERLGRRDPLPEELEPLIDVSLQPEIDPERIRMMELLKQLEQGQEAAIEPKDTLVDKPSPQPASGFVTLSDYINQILKSEGQDLQRAN
jgi:hypothetical protein